MSGRRSPYTILGLKPGAGRVAVDEAYRRLMKRHHPDLPGGDPAQATELNRAYAALKGEAPVVQPALPAPRGGESFARPPSKRRGQAAGLLMVLAAGAAVFFAPSLPSPVERLPQPAAGVRHRGSEPLAGTLALRGEPDEAAIASAVAAARRLGGARPGQAASFSRSCEQDLKTYPSLALLDHCTAFDAASGLLGGAAPDARFRAEEMAARHVGAAMRLLNDPVLAEERIGIVRREVEQLLVEPPQR